MYKFKKRYLKVFWVIIFLFLVIVFIKEASYNNFANEKLVISYLDVGQGDCAFIELPNGKSVLIDSGNYENAYDIINFIKQSGTYTLYYVIATHPHADHIGSMAEIINTFNVKNFYMPKAYHTTTTFENLLDTIDAKGLTIQTAKAGKTIFKFGSVKAEFLAPNSQGYDNLNDYSAVIMLTYNNKKFLFMGDAQKQSENEILSAGFDVAADVIKVGHHGSDTSSTQNFIKAVNPSIAVISVGSDNSYGHPDKLVLTTLSQSNAQVWRTDEKGTIIVTCDGVNITLSNIKKSVQSNAPPSDSLQGDNIIVYITETGSKYHRADCRHLHSSKIAVELDKLDTKKYLPCSVCNPPVK